MNEKDIQHIVTALKKKFKWEAIDYDKIESIISPTDCKVIAVLDDFRTMIEAEAVDWEETIQKAIEEHEITSTKITFQLALKAEWDVLKTIVQIEEQIITYYGKIKSR